MDRADGVAELTAGVFAAVLDCLDRGPQVANVIQRVENPDDIHPIPAHAVHKGLHHIVRKAGVLDDILSAQQHQLRRLWRDALEGAQTVKGVLTQVAKAGVNGCTTQVSSPWKPISSRMGAAGNIWAVVIRVAAID
jgi:hypothetical protein